MHQRAAEASLIRMVLMEREATDLTEPRNQLGNFLRFVLIKEEIFISLRALSTLEALISDDNVRPGEKSLQFSRVED